MSDYEPYGICLRREDLDRTPDNLERHADCLERLADAYTEEIGILKENASPADLMGAHLNTSYGWARAIYTATEYRNAASILAQAYCKLAAYKRGQQGETDGS